MAKESEPIAELIAHVHDALADAAETEGVIAREIVEDVIDRVITALRKDDSGRIPERSREAWEAFFSDASDRATSDLHRLNGLISREQAIWAIEDFFADASTDDKPSAPQASAEAS
jgi:hypothetical protein